MREAGIGEGCPAQGELLEAGHAPQRGESLTGNLGLAQVERLEPGHPFQVDHAGIGDRVVAQVEMLEARQARESSGEARVVQPAPRQREGLQPLRLPELVEERLADRMPETGRNC